MGNTLFIASNRARGSTVQRRAALRGGKRPRKESLRIGSDGKAYAFDYKYVLPQVAKYELDQGGTNFSFASVDWTQPTAPVLLTGNYHRGTAPGDKYYNPPPTLAWWSLDETRTGIVSRANLLITGRRNQRKAPHRTQESSGSAAAAMRLTCTLSETGITPVTAGLTDARTCTTRRIQEICGVHRASGTSKWNQSNQSRWRKDGYASLIVPLAGM